MEENQLKTPPATSKRLLFDRRYGWVVDDWKSPADEALSGGRGMFCILPLAKGFMNTASNSLIFRLEKPRGLECEMHLSLASVLTTHINKVTNSAVQILERRDELSLPSFQANVEKQLQQLGASVSKPIVSLLTFKDKLCLLADDSSLQHRDNSNVKEPETA